MRPILVLLAAALVAGCETYVPPRPLPPVVVPEPADDVGTACALACAHMRELGCSEGNGSVGGAPCALTCVKAHELRFLPLSCWISARTPAEARACGSLRCIR